MGSKPMITQIMTAQPMVLPCFEPSDFQVFVGTGELSEHLGISSRRVSELVHAHVLPQESRGRFDLAACSKAYIEFLQRPEVAARRAAAIGLPGHKNISNARAALLQAQAERAELRLGVERGALIPADDFRELVGGAFRTVRDRFLNLPSRIAPELEGETRIVITQRLDAAIRDVLTILSRGPDEQGLETSRNSPGPEGGLPTSANAGPEGES